MIEFDYIELTCNTCRFYHSINNGGHVEWYCAVNGKYVGQPIELYGTLDNDCPIADKPSIGSLFMDYKVVK